VLTEMVLNQMRVASPTQLIHEIYYRDLHRHAIAWLAALVQRASDAGDAVAAQILARAGSELAAAASSVVSRLEMRGDVFPTVLAGGIFRGIPWLVGDVTARMSEVAPRTDVRVLDVAPAVGAVRLAVAAAHGRATIPSYV
jgi:N-acetylglucosamine kinase-like BadF-type ATPase